METLDQLELCVDALLSQMDTLREENRKLKDEQDHAVTRLNEENTLLKTELEQEKQRAGAALEKVDAIIRRLKERTLQE
jgi:hypothetical protein